MPAFSIVTVPAGDPIRNADGKLQVPDRPIIPFIEGDGTGSDIWRASQAVFDAAVEKAYGGRRRIAWMEVFAGEKAFNRFQDWLPEDTVTAFKEFVVGIKGPLTTPVGGGIRSLNVTLRQMLDLYVCLRPVRYFAGVPSPVKRPDQIDMVIFRENTEDIYAGVEWAAETPEARKVIAFLQQEMGVKKIRFPETSGIGIKPISRQGTERLVRAAVEYALRHGRRSVTFVHKGNIMKFTEGAFRDWGYGLATREYRDRVVTERESWILGNREETSGISVQDNARAIDPGYDMMTPDQQAKVRRDVEAGRTGGVTARCRPELADAPGVVEERVVEIEEHRPHSGTSHMWAMIALPNPEHDVSVAPSIRRWKSYVTVFAPIAPSMPFVTRSAASSQPRWRSIISPERITEPGFTLSRLAYFGAVPCVASKMAWPVT